MVFKRVSLGWVAITQCNHTVATAQSNKHGSQFHILQHKTVTGISRVCLPQCCCPGATKIGLHHTVSLESVLFLFCIHVLSSSQFHATHLVQLFVARMILLFSQFVHSCLSHHTMSHFPVAMMTTHCRPGELQRLSSPSFHAIKLPSTACPLRFGPLEMHA